MVPPSQGHHLGLLPLIHPIQGQDCHLGRGPGKFPEAASSGRDRSVEGDSEQEGGGEVHNTGTALTHGRAHRSMAPSKTGMGAGGCTRPET